MKDDRLSMLSIMYIEAEVLNIKSDDILVFIGVCLCVFCFIHHFCLYKVQLVVIHDSG